MQEKRKGYKTAKQQKKKLTKDGLKRIKNTKTT